MKRDAYQALLSWKKSPDRKPLIMFGARQVGKTWLLNEFGKNEYNNVAVINLDEHPELQNSFQDYDTERLIRLFSATANQRIIPEETLLILDEIQEAPLALTSLKYFQEKANQFHIAAAGSLLGLSLHEGTGYPVGKTDEIQLYPLSFREFLAARGKDILIEQLQSHKWDELNQMLPMLIELLRQYYFTGGMPAVVKTYCENEDLQKSREVQLQILRDYERDFAKHIPPETLPKVKMVWNSIPSQLARENKKFIYGAMKKGARAKEFEDAIQWLQDAGLVYRVPRVSKIAAPLKFYEDYSSFKLFMVDLGLFGAMTGATAKQVLVDHSVFEEYKGSFTEQFVLQQLIAEQIKPYYFSNDSHTLEIDFVIQKENVYPIEVKAEENLRAKSLRTVVNANNDLKGLRFSMSPYREQDWMTNVPLPMIQEWVNNIEPS